MVAHALTYVQDRKRRLSEGALGAGNGEEGRSADERIMELQRLFEEDSPLPAAAAHTVDSCNDIEACIPDVVLRGDSSECDRRAPADGLADSQVRSSPTSRVDQDLSDDFRKKACEFLQDSSETLG